MTQNNIDLDALKKRGFLKQKQEGFFLLRVRKACGNFQAQDLEKLAQISRSYAKGLLHTTTRQGIEIPFIKYEDIPVVEKTVKDAGIEAGTSGPRLRTTTSCPGNNWCKSGLIDTFKLYKRIEEDLNIKCGMDLPHKFKIAISGCSNTCTRAQQSEFGIHGAVDVLSADKHIGYVVYLAGCGGKTPRLGFKLDKVFTEEEVLSLIRKTVAFFKDNAKPRQRLALLLEEFGRDRFVKEVLEL